MSKLDLQPLAPEGSPRSRRGRDCAQGRKGRMAIIDTMEDSDSISSISSTTTNRRYPIRSTRSKSASSSSASEIADSDDSETYQSKVSKRPKKLQKQQPKQKQTPATRNKTQKPNSKQLLPPPIAPFELGPLLPADMTGPDSQHNPLFLSLLQRRRSRNPNVSSSTPFYLSHIPCRKHLVNLCQTIRMLYSRFGAIRPTPSLFLAIQMIQTQKRTIAV